MPPSLAKLAEGQQLYSAALKAPAIAAEKSPIVTIRPMSHADRADALRINTGSRPAVAALDRIEFERLLALDNNHLVAVAGDGNVVGYMLVFAHHCGYDGQEFQYFLAHLGQPFLYVDQVAVERDHQGSGIGRQLYAALVALARARQVKVLCCEVNTSPPNRSSSGFHRQLGFTAMGNGDTLDGRRVEFLVTNV